MNLSDNLKKIRKDNNLSQEQLADKIGVSRQAVSKWESGLAYPEMDKVMQICKIFNLNIDELLNRDISEVNENKEAKININKLVDDFLDYISKTVDVISMMKFKTKVKCFFEQIIIALITICILFFIGLIFLPFVQDLLRFLPDNLNYFIYQIIFDLYIIVSTILAVILLLHIFKVRYLDYFVVEKQSKEETNLPNENSCVKSQNEKNNQILRKEKIIIRDPEHSGYKFIFTMLKFLLIFLKFFVSLIALVFAFTLVLLFTLLILLFMFVKTGLVFIGALLFTISLIIINILTLNVLYNFIISKKIKKSLIGIFLSISLCLMGCGIAFSLIGLTNFKYVNSLNHESFMKETKTINIKENTVIVSYNTQVEYIESNLKDVVVEFNHMKHASVNIFENQNGCFKIYSYLNINDPIAFIKMVIKDINNKNIVNYDSSSIKVYASKENINILKSNYDKKMQSIYNMQEYYE